MAPPRDAGDIELNMTPMIDVVFNLIVFFMIVSDLTRKEIEDLALPRASMSVPDGEGEERLIVNISKAPDHAETGAVRIAVRGREYDLEGLRALLFAAAERRRAGEGDFPPSELPVLIRCDRDVRWRVVQHVMQACADRAVGIYRIQFATAKHRDEGR